MRGQERERERMCVREREHETVSEKEGVRERDSERENKRERERVCVRERDGERERACSERGMMWYDWPAESLGGQRNRFVSDDISID